jgi:hypothetical protein
MRWSFMLATATLAATVMLRSPPASAANQCPKKRTIVVGKGETQVLAKKQCKHKFIKKGLEAFGQAYVIVGKLMSCEEIGNPKGGNDYWQCICSAYICKHIPLDPGGDPDLDWKPKKFNRDPGILRVPHSSFGTRRAAAPSFRLPSMGPKLR